MPQKLSSEYEKEQDEIEAAALCARVDNATDSAERIEDFLKLTCRYRDFSELTVPMLNEFMGIERIVVQERGEKWCRHTEQQIDIFLNFIGTFEIPVQPEAEQRWQDELAAKMKKREYHREYQRKYQRKLAREKRAVEADELPMAANQ